jgi:hypothetical protein
MVASRFGRTAGLALAACLGSAAPTLAAREDAPAAFAVADRSAILVVHAAGAQVYECKPDAGGRAVWTFREPIATLILDGRTIGRHYGGPTWELDDGGSVTGAPLASAPGATPSDVPLLKLRVAAHRGGGALRDATLVLRLHTRGGALGGACANLGELRAEAYAADYAFLR